MMISASDCDCEREKESMKISVSDSERERKRERVQDSTFVFVFWGFSCQISTTHEVRITPWNFLPGLKNSHLPQRFVAVEEIFSC